MQADNGFDNGNGGLNLMVSIMTAIFAWITMKDVQVIMTLIATGVSITTGIFASMHYYKQIKKKDK